jgi:hypothetical protein
MTDPLPRPAKKSDGADPTWDRLEDQLGWYDRKSVTAQQAYNRIKLGQLVVGATVPVVAALQAPAAVTAVLAAIVVVAEGAQQLYQWQTNWVLYRATAEALKHERFLYLAAAGPYSTDDRHRVLAERLEGLVSQEHARWTEVRQRDTQEPAADVRATQTSRPS